jgi:hypothetical protein
MTDSSSAGHPSQGSRTGTTRGQALKPAPVSTPRRGGGLGRKVLGASVLGALGLGIFLGQYLPKLGLFPGGSGIGLGESAPPTGIKNTESNPSESTALAATPDAEQPRPDGTAPITVRIDGHDFVLIDAAGQAQTASLEEIVKAIQTAQPNPRGLRVRIAPTPEARAKSESDLKEALRSAGIPETEIVWSE